MNSPSRQLLEFLEIVFADEMRLWRICSSDQDAIRSIARGYAPMLRHDLVSELDALLGSDIRNEQLLAIAERAGIDVAKQGDVREWFEMIRAELKDGQRRLMSAAPGRDQ